MHGPPSTAPTGAARTGSATVASPIKAAANARPMCRSGRPRMEVLVDVSPIRDKDAADLSLETLQVLDLVCFELGGIEALADAVRVDRAPRRWGVRHHEVRAERPFRLDHERHLVRLQVREAPTASRHRRSS